MKGCDADKLKKIRQEICLTSLPCAKPKDKMEFPT